MMRFSRFVSSLTLACCIAGPGCCFTAYADDAAPTSVSPDAAATASPLADLVDTYWHYGKIARYDLAVDAGNKILASGSDPRTVLEAFEAEGSKKGDNVDAWLLRWRTLPIPTDASAGSIKQMRDVSSKVADVINQGYETRRSDPDFIRKTIIEMSTNERAYEENLPRLQKSGELAVKVIVDYLGNAQFKRYNNTCRRILRDLGRSALAPLLAATEMKDYDTLVDVISALGDLGYPSAVPYLTRLYNSPDVPDAIHVTAKNALTHLGVASSLDANNAQQFYDLAVKLYYGRADLTPSGDKVSNIWFWTTDHGLTKRDVPTSIFGDVMAMRETEYALKINGDYDDAISLWLAANTRREVDLPAGGKDSTHVGMPDAHYYNVSAGVKYLSGALGRAIHDRNPGLALKLTQSMENIVGQSNLAGASGTPIQLALSFPNRQVRYAAAFALAESFPAESFKGSDRVVPLLTEALNQTSKPNILVVAPSDDGTMNVLHDAIQTLGLTVVAASNSNDAPIVSASLPSVDVIIISEDCDVKRLVELENSTDRLQGASVLVLTHSPDSMYSVASATDPLMNAMAMPPKAVLGATLKTAIDQARAHAGVAPLTDKQASEDALKAAALLSQLALARGTAFDISVAEPTLLTALNDPRPEVAKAAGRVLSMLSSATAQQGLASKALDDSTPADVRVALFKSLATSAKINGNHLDDGSIESLEKIVTTSTAADLRGAAAEARGALNLAANEAKTLILNQATN